MCDVFQQLPNIYQRLPAICEGIQESTFSLSKINVTIAGETSAAVCSLLCAASVQDLSSLSKNAALKHVVGPRKCLMRIMFFSSNVCFRWQMLCLKLQWSSILFDKNWFSQLPGLRKISHRIFSDKNKSLLTEVSSVCLLVCLAVFLHPWVTR